MATVTNREQAVAVIRLRRLAWLTQQGYGGDHISWFQRCRTPADAAPDYTQTKTWPALYVRGGYGGDHAPWLHPPVRLESLPAIEPRSAITAAFQFSPQPTYAEQLPWLHRIAESATLRLDTLFSPALDYLFTTALVAVIDQLPWLHTLAPVLPPPSVVTASSAWSAFLVAHIQPQVVTDVAWLHLPVEIRTPAPASTVPSSAWSAVFTATLGVPYLHPLESLPALPAPASARSLQPQLWIGSSDTSWQHPLPAVGMAPFPLPSQASRWTAGTVPAPNMPGDDIAWLHVLGPARVVVTEPPPYIFSSWILVVVPPSLTINIAWVGITNTKLTWTGTTNTKLVWTGVTV